MKALKQKLLYVVSVVLFFIAAFTNINAAASAETIKLKAEIERSILPADTKQSALIKITLLAPANSANENTRKYRINLAVVIDKSGSMSSAGKIENAKAAAVTALKMLKPDDVFSLIVYDNFARTLISSASVTNPAAIEEVINGISAGGSTALFAGVSVAANEVRKNLREGFVNRILLLSDGQANVGPSSPDELGRLGTSLLKEGISVSTVGVGRDYNEDLMTTISQNSDGNFYFVKNSADLPMIFSKELRSALKVAAQGIEIKITCPEGVKPQGVLGHECKINGNTMELFFNQVYGGHEKSLILQVEVPPEQPDKKMKIATVEMSYKSEHGTKYSLSESVEASFSRDMSKVEGSANDMVLDEAAITQNALYNRDALREAEKGRFDKAKDFISKGMDALSSRASKSSASPALKKEVLRAEMNAQEINADLDQSKQIDTETKKKIQGETYQQLNQQIYKQ